jgi:hypothetical protein
MCFVFYVSSGFSFVLCGDLTNAQVMPVSGILKNVTFEKDDNQMTTNVEPKKNDGLSTGQAAERLVTDGYNELPSSKKRHILAMALEVLRDLSSPRALVIRDGQPQRIPGRAVVRGDTLVLAEGDRVSADTVIIHNTHLSTFTNWPDKAIGFWEWLKPFSCNRACHPSSTIFSSNFLDSLAFQIRSARRFRRPSPNAAMPA